MKLRDWLDLVTLGAIWGASYLFMRVAVPQIGPVPVMALRALLSSLSLLPFLLRSPDTAKAALSPKFRELVVLSLINQSIPFCLFGFAALHLPIGISAILNATVPLFGAVVGAIWFGSPLKARVVAGLVLGFAGVTLLILSRTGSVYVAGSGGGHSQALAIAACLTASLCYGISGNYTRKHFSGIHPVLTNAGCQSLAALELCPIAIFFLPAGGPDLKAWLSVVALALLCTSVAYVLYYRLIRNVGATNTMSVTYLIPVFGVLWGALFLREEVSRAMIASGFVILAGVAIALRSNAAPGAQSR